MICWIEFVDLKMIIRSIDSPLAATAMTKLSRPKKSKYMVRFNGHIKFGSRLLSMRLRLVENRVFKCVLKWE